MEFVSGRAAVTDLAEINETLHPIGFGLWPLDVGAAPDAIQALLAQPTLTDDEAAPVLQRFLLPREQLLEVVAAAGRAPQVAGGGELSTFDATNGVTYPQLFVIAPGVDYTRFDHFHVNSATGGGGLDEVLQVLSGGGVQVRQHLPDEGEFVVTIDCPTPRVRLAPHVRRWPTTHRKLQLGATGDQGARAGDRSAAVGGHVRRVVKPARAGVTLPGMGKLLERLGEGTVICAEGYLFEFERRGYLQAGAFVPEVVLEEPALVAQLHREFVHAGSDVVEAFTYYAHREKLALIGREDDLEAINRQALQIAGDVAAEHGSLFAGNICNTNIFEPDDAESQRRARAMFDEQVGWAAEAGVDLVIGETFSYAQEALVALSSIKAAGLDAVITLAIHRHPETARGLGRRRGVPAHRGRRRRRGRAELHPRTRHDAAAAAGRARGMRRTHRRTPRAVPHDGGGTHVPVTHRSRLRPDPGRAPVPDCARPVHVQPVRAGGVRDRCR